MSHIENKPPEGIIIRDVLTNNKEPKRENIWMELKKTRSAHFPKFKVLKMGISILRNFLPWNKREGYVMNIKIEISRKEMSRLIHLLSVNPKDRTVFKLVPYVKRIRKPKFDGADFFNDDVEGLR